MHLFFILLIALTPQTACNEGAAKHAGMEIKAPLQKENPVESIAENFDLAYIMGQFDPAGHPSFTPVDPVFAVRQGMYLRKDAYEAFKKMAAAAAEDGIKLTILSAARNFEQQKLIWEAKWTGARTLEGGESAPDAYPDPKDRAMAILRYSSMPGSSRHHWGTDMDLNNLNNIFFEKGDGKKIYDWLVKNASGFGFAQPYTAGRPHGYQEERWHWSYLPVSTQLTRLAKDSLRDGMIKGFQGAETAVDIRIVEHYVLGVNPACLP